MPATQLLVVVNSNFEPERELSAVVLRVAGKERARIAITADEGPEIPFSFGVSPPGGDANARVMVEAEALSANDTPLACPARAQLGFVAGEARLVQLELTRACGTAACGCDASETCREGECVPSELDVRTLPKVQPGRELEGVERSPSTTLPEPERPICNEDNGAWSDVARALTRNHDGQLCPVMTDGNTWGAWADSLELNQQALDAYIARQLEVEHDVLTLQVSWLAGELRVVGLVTPDVDTAAMPTLEETLRMPALQEAQQPLQLVFREGSAVGASTWLHTLPRLLIDSGVVQRCRPIYLTSFGREVFGALRQLRNTIREQPRWSTLWDHVHFSRRLTSSTPDIALEELDEAVEQSWDRVAIDAQRVDLPYLRRNARSRGVLTHFYNVSLAHQVADLCDGMSGLESLLFTERPPEIRWQDELRFQLSSARTLLDLDVGGLPAGSTTVSYKSHPNLEVIHELNLTAGQPTLVTGDQGTRWGDTDTVLRFSAEQAQRLALHDVTFDMERPERKYFAWPNQTMMVMARLPVSSLPVGARQAIVSKLRGESGWALQLINEGAGTVVQYLWYGRDRDDQTVRALKGSIEVVTLSMQLDALMTIFVKNHGLAIEDNLKMVVSDAEPNAYYQHIMITNDAPITLGSDPDGGGYFDGDIQSVKISAMYGGGAKF